MLSERFGLENTETGSLEGMDNHNCLVAAGGAKYVLKTYLPRPNLGEELKAETAVLRHLAKRGIASVPEPVPDVGGAYVFRAGSGRDERLVRLLRFVDGKVLGADGFADRHLSGLGHLAARVDRELADLRFTAIEAKVSFWDLQNWKLQLPNVAYIQNAADRKYVEYFFQRTKELVDPELPFLRRQLIHGDLNEWNVVERGDGSLALIDYGDICYSPLVTEIAIALCYALMWAGDKESAANALLSSYTALYPLEEKELSLLFDLVALRACISVCRSARSRVEMPDNEYARVSDRRAWDLIRHLASRNPVRMEQTFREAAGLDPRGSAPYQDDLNERLKNTSAALSLQFDKPIRMRGAAFQFMFDAEGESYLDCYNNIPHIGHCHPAVTRAITRASLKLNTNTRYLTEEFNLYSTKLLERFPERLNKVFFVNSGSAATDLALRLANAHTDRETVVVVEHGYHGNTRSGIGVSHYKYAGKGGSGRQAGVIEVPIPELTREGDNERDFFEEMKARVKDDRSPVSAFIAEPIVGCGGQVPLPEGYLKRVYEYVRALGGVCISDEVQTGFGRLGECFWGFEIHGVEPDLVVIGKPIGNGHPMAAVITTQDIAASFETGMEFFSSFGGNSVSCAVGQAVLEVIDSESLQLNAAAVGAHLLEGLERLVEEFESCGEARGRGLFLGLELVKYDPALSPETALAGRVKNRLRAAGVLVGTDGPFNNVIKIKPPICFTRENADRLLASLEAALREG